MQSASRRLWTRSVSTIAVLLVLAATVSSLFSLAVQQVPGYRDQLQDRIRQAVGKPVTIGALSLRWHWFEPVVQIDDVLLPMADPVLPPVFRIEHLKLGFSLLRLVRRNWIPAQIAISGGQIKLEVRDGRVSIPGFEITPGGDPRVLADRLDQIKQLRLERCRIVVDDDRLSGDPLVFGVDTAVLRTATGLHRLDAALQLPSSIGGTLSASARWDHSLAALSQSSGSWTLRLAGLLNGSAATGLQALLASRPLIAAQGLQLDSEGEWSAGRLAQARSRLQWDRLAAVVGGQQVAGLGRTELTSRLSLDDGGYHLLLDPLRIEGQRGSWPASQLEADWSPQRGNTAARVSVKSRFLRLDDLLPWLALIRPDAQPTLGSSLVGDVSELIWQREFTGATSAAWGNGLSLKFENAGLHGVGRIPNLTGLSGQLHLDQAGGEIQIDGDGAELQRPGLFGVPVDFDHLATRLQLTPDGAGWKLVSNSFDYALVGVTGSGQLSMAGQPGVAPTLNLALDFSSPDGIRLKPLMPVNWGVSTRDWIQAAIQKMAIPSAHFESSGPAMDFPYGKRPTGHWQLDLEAADGILQFRPDWPAAQKLHAKLHFNGPGMHIVVDQAALNGNSIDQVDADIASFVDQPRLMLDGRAHGDAAQVYELLKQTPLHARLSGLVDRTHATGALQASLHLEVPLKAGESPLVSRGTISLQGDTLSINGLKPPLTQLRGDVAFDAAGVRSEQLAGRFYDTDLAGRIDADSDSPAGIARINFAVGFSPNDAVVDAFVPAWLSHWLDGRSNWSGELPLSGPKAGKLLLSTDLAGVAVHLPVPLDKKAIEPGSLGIKVGSDTQGALSIGIDYGSLLTGLLGFGGRDAGGGLQAVQLYLGDSSPTPQIETGITIEGRVPRLDLPGWIDFIDGIGNLGSADTDPLPAANPARFRRLDLTAVQLGVGHDFHAPETHLLVTPTDTGFAAVLAGEGAEGTVDVTTNGLDRRVKARLDHFVALADTRKKLAAPTPAPPITSDPVTQPTYDLSCLRLRIGDADLGRLDALTERIPDGQKIVQLQLVGGLLAANAQGSWQRDAQGSRANLDFNVDSQDLGHVLTAFDYAASLTGRRSQLSGKLVWASDAKGIEPARASGNVDIKVDNGSLTAVDAAAARILGLLNLYALPRRILLNFRDVTGKGLAFDHLKGRFQLADGQAHTDDMALTGAAYRITMNGRIGLVARDFDEHITVYPDVSTTAVIGATVLGGPIVGGIVLVAQELLGKPLNTLSQFSYSLTGSWDDPVTTPGDARPRAASAITPPPSSSSAPIPP